MGCFYPGRYRRELAAGPVRGEGNLARMINAIRAGRFPPLNITANRRSMVSVADLIHAAMLVSQHEQANGEIYIVSDGRSYSTAEIYAAMCRALNKDQPNWHVPVWPLSILANIGDAIGRLTGRPFVFNSEALGRLTGSACYQNEKLRGLGWQPTQTLADVLPAMLAKTNA